MLMPIEQAVGHLLMLLIRTIQASAHLAHRAALKVGRDRRLDAMHARWVLERQSAVEHERCPSSIGRRDTIHRALQLQPVALAQPTRLGRPVCFSGGVGGFLPIIFSLKYEGGWFSTRPRAI